MTSKEYAKLPQQLQLLYLEFYQAYWRFIHGK